MRIVCESCSTAYTIADEKVRGRLCKIRCKKCGGVVMVRGPSEEPPAAESGWHLLVDGETVGPLSEAELRARATDEDLVWRDGLDEWRRLGDLERETEAPPPVEARMVGERNESSALFSLDTLQSIASGARPQFGGGGGAAAAASSEGSGLIDIRKMAAEALAYAPPADEERAPSSGGVPMFAPLAAPVLTPAPPRAPLGWLVALLAGGLLAIGGLVLVIASRRAIEPSAAPPPRVERAAPPPVEKTAPALAGKVTPGEPSPGRAAPIATEPRAHEARPATHSRERATVARRDAPPPPTAGAEPPARPTPPRVERSAPVDELDRMLHEDPPAAAEKPARVIATDEPEQLSSADLKGGFNSVRSKVDACFSRFPSARSAMVSVTIAGSGKVTAATVAAPLGGTPVAECIAAAVRGAGFGRFKGAPMAISYPFLHR